MRSKSSWARLLAVLLALGLIAAACGDSDDDDAGDDASASSSASASASEPADTTATTEAATEDTEAATEDTEGGGAEEMAGSLTDCPSPLVLQTDWFPEPEHGALYELIDHSQAEATPDGYSGPLEAEPSITVEVRAGGFVTNFSSPRDLMYTSDEVFLGYVTNDEAVSNYEDFPTLAVVAPLEINPQIVQWDPETYTGIESFSDIGATGAIINHFPGAVYMEYLIGTGQVSADQSDPSYDGGPQRFIAEEGAIFQQGFATQEPFNYEFEFEEWGRPVDFLLIHDSGYEPYSQTLAIRPDRLEDPAVVSCLQAFVPEVQRAAVDFMEDPQDENDAIEAYNFAIDDFWQLSQEAMASTVVKMEELGIASNGPDDTIGNFDLDRVEGLIDILRNQVDSIDVPDDLTAEDIVTNEFIDPTIGR
ncbi:MAG: ABC transporter substrate-binding protein [Actinomycetota bacterium]